MRTIIILAVSSFIFFSCDKPAILDLDQTPARIVIEGLVTNRLGHQSVKITRSVDFYTTGKTPRVTNAVVTVKDDLGNLYTFVHNPRSHGDSTGIYIPQNPFAGEIGRTYTLHVEVDGDTYEASDELYSVMSMDSLDYRVNEDEAEDPKYEGKIYEVLMFAREPQDQTNFYLFKFYQNDTLKTYNDTDIYFSSDEFLAEKIDGVPSPVFYGLNDEARIEMYSITRSGYVYYTDLFTILHNDAGGMFGPIPSSPRTNLSNGALGFFQVSALNDSEIRIE